MLNIVIKTKDIFINKLNENTSDKFKGENNINGKYNINQVFDMYKTSIILNCSFPVHRKSVPYGPSFHVSKLI